MTRIPMLKKYGKHILMITLFCGLLLGKAVITLGYTAALTVESTAVNVGDTVQFGIAVSGTTAAEVPQIKSGNGLQIQYLGPTSQFQIINWKKTESITFNYLLNPLQPGRYTLGPYKIRAGSRNLTTNAVTITVNGSGGTSPGGNSLIPGTDQNARNPAPAGPERAGEKLFLTLSLPRNRLYVGEEVPATIKLYVGEVKVDELSYPQLQQSQFMIGKMPKPEKTQEIVNGLSYQVLTFRTSLTPVKTGAYVLGPVELSCSVLVTEDSEEDPFSDFFQDYQRKSVTLRSKSYHVNVMDLPKAGRPQDFSGGIGRFQMKVTATPTAVLQGDPITVQINLTGQGNLESVAAPRLVSPSGLKVYDAARKKPSGGRTQDDDLSADRAAHFEQVVIPTDRGLKRLGPYLFSYFDPQEGRYREIEAPALPITVNSNPNFKSESGGGPGVPAVSGERLGEDLIYIKATPGSLKLGAADAVRQPLFWLLQLMPVLAVAGSWGYRRRREKLQADTPRARTQRAAAKAGRELGKVRQALQEAKPDPVLDELHRIVREYLAEKFNLAAAGMTQSVAEDLKAWGLEPELLERVRAFFGDYDFYKYTGVKPTVENGREFLGRAEGIIQSLNRQNEVRGLTNGMTAAGRKGEIQ